MQAASVLTSDRSSEQSRGHLAEVLRSEFCKFRSVPATAWTIAIAIASNVVLAALAGLFIPTHLSEDAKVSTDAVRLSLAGLHLSQIACGVLGALVVTSEYSTGMIRATFAAVPRRRLVLLAKVVVYALTTLVVGVVSCLAAFLVFQAATSDAAFTSSLSDPGVTRAVIGGGLYLAVLGLLGMGLGMVLRHSAGTIATLFGLLFVPSILMSILPATWQATIGPYLPMIAGEQIFIATAREPNALGPWTGFGVLCLYALIALISGFVLTSRRDV